MNTNNGASTDRAYTADVGGKPIEVRAGRLAPLAGGAVTVRIGDTMILSTATASKKSREGIDFFPLSVDLEEKLYAAGRIPGSFFRREGRPGEAAILTARLIDRPLRPLFPKGARNEVQIINTALSSDGQNLLDIPALIGSSAALMISDVPFPGPVAAVRIGRVDGAFVVNPTSDEMAESDLDLRIAGTADAILMVECGAEEIDEDTMVRAIRHGHEAMQPAIQMQLEMQRDLGKEKRTFAANEIPADLVDRCRQWVGDRIDRILEETRSKEERSERMDALEAEWMAEHELESVDLLEKDIKGAFGSIVKERVRERILADGVRPDGRGPDEIRPLSADVALSPRAHGSGLFQRGETQVLSVATLGTLGEEQRLDTLRPEETKRFLHHYNFPPFSTGETWFLRGPKRREIGHGALAETALRSVIPPEDEFPYTIRIVSEVLASNGSSSMASVCASTLALMDAGIPIRQPVAGIAMGLVTDPEDPARHRVLTDIQGIEDHLGDMDFKVAGTRDGITALQMDIKLGGLSNEIMKEALSAARRARLEILDVMQARIAEPRPELSPYAPRIITIKVDPEFIGKIIGPGGSMVRAIQEETGTRVDIQEDGTVYVAAVEGAGADAALAKIEALTQRPEPGRQYEGKVRRIEPFGAFVEIMPGIDGLVHISQLSAERVDRVEDVVLEGTVVLVMLTDVSDGKDRLCRRYDRDTRRPAARERSSIVRWCAA